MSTASRTTLALLFSAAAIQAQENNRNLDRPGVQTKFLTPNQVDSWHFEGKKGEWVTAAVTSGEFDPVLKLVDDDKEAVLQDVDDRGSESFFAAQLPADGKFRIQIHAFKMSGGGNYRLEVRRFASAPLELGRELPAVLGSDGRSWFDFAARKGQTVVAWAEGAIRNFEILDPKGRPLERWETSVLCKQDGTHFLAIVGESGVHFRTAVRAATRREFTDARDLEGELTPGAMDVWTFQGEPGQFVFTETQMPNTLRSRLTLVRPDPESEGRQLDSERDRPEFQSLPVGSKASRPREAVVLGRKTEYQLQVLSPTFPGTYRLRRSDPVVPLAVGSELTGRLAVGSATFHGFTADAGQLVRIGLSSTHFDPLLRMTDDHGVEIAANDDAGTDLASRITFLVHDAGRYRLQLSSRGDGGGGEYRIAFEELAIPQLEAGAWASGTLGPGARDYFRFSAKAGQNVLVLVRSDAFEPVAEVLGPGGERLGSGERRGPSTDAVLAIRVPREGRHTLWLSSKSGEGSYRVKVLDAD